VGICTNLMALLAILVCTTTLSSAAFAEEAGHILCPTPSMPIAAMRSEAPVVGNYRDVLAAARCMNLHCNTIDYVTRWAQVDYVLFDRSRPPLSGDDLRLVLADQKVTPTLLAAEHDVERGRFRQAFRTYLDDFQSNVSGVRTLYLDDDGGTGRVRSVLEQLGRRPATIDDARALTDVANQHKDEFAPLLYLGAVLLELGCKPQALHVYRLIPFVRPVAKSRYSGVSITAMRLALSVDQNAWSRSPADRPSRSSSNPPGI
jgi:hypothetical protein